MAPVARTLNDLYPDGAFFFGRTTREAMAWNVADASKLPAYRLDATPAQLIGFAGAMAFIAHEAASTDLALDFISHCGLPRPENLCRYRTETEGAEQAGKLMDLGGLLVHNFGTLPQLQDRAGHLVPLAQYLHLNAKTALAEFVPQQYLPQRRVVAVADLARISEADAGLPVYLKVGGAVSNGGGGAVRWCETREQLDTVIAEFCRRLPAQTPVVIERDYGAIPSWCAGVSVLDDGVRWLGASLQLFSSPGRQAGNVMAVEGCPAELEPIAMEIGKRAHALGYRGVAGFDIGVRCDADAVVFDLNFRPNSSTGLWLAGPGALDRTGLGVARSFYFRFDGPLEHMLDVVETEAALGRIIPGSIFDAQAYKQTSDDPSTRSCLDGWMLAESLEQANETIARLGEELNAKQT